MGELLPRNNADRVAFFNTRTALWTSNATAIGTTTAAVTALESLITAASAGLAAQTTAQNAAKATTETVNSAMDAMTNSGMAIIEQVRTKARSAGDGVYPLANIPAPATPTPADAPGTPYKFAATLRPDGSLFFKWSCDNGTGGAVTYQIYRVIDGGDRSFIGGAGKRQFIDSDIPSGSASITYTIQATRTTSVGVEQDFTVKFGTDSGGTATVAVVENAQKPAKIAA